MKWLRGRFWRQLSPDHLGGAWGVAVDSVLYKANNCEAFKTYLDVLTLARHTAGLLSHKMRLKRGCLVKDGPQVLESVLCSQQKPVLDHVDAEPCACGWEGLHQAPTLAGVNHSTQPAPDSLCGRSEGGPFWGLMPLIQGHLSTTSHQPCTRLSRLCAEHVLFTLHHEHPTPLSETLRC